MDCRRIRTSPCSVGMGHRRLRKRPTRMNQRVLMLKHSTAWIFWVVCLLASLPAGAMARELKSRGGLPNDARIARDAFGVPHLSAKNERDVVFLQGYVHAQDRLFQMDVTRRQAEGTL